MDNQGNIVQFPADLWGFSLLQSAQNSHGPPAYYSIGIRSSFLKDKTVEAWRWPPDFVQSRGVVRVELHLHSLIRLHLPVRNHITWICTSLLRINSTQSVHRPWRCQEIEALRFEDNRNVVQVVRLSALRTGRIYSPGNIPGTHFC